MAEGNRGTQGINLIREYPGHRLALLSRPAVARHTSDAVWWGELCHSTAWQSQRLWSTNNIITAYAVVALSCPGNARPRTNTSASKRNQNLKVTLCAGPAGELLSAPFGKQRGDRLLPLGQYLVLLPQGYCQDSCVPLGFIPGGCMESKKPGWYFCWWCHHLLADFLQQRAKLWPKPLVAPAALCDSGANICLMNHAVRRRDSSLPRSILLCPAHGNTPEGGPQAPRLSLCRTGYSNRLQTRGEEGKWEGAFGSVGLGNIYRGPQPRAGWGTEAPLRKFP